MVVKLRKCPYPWRSISCVLPALGLLCLCLLIPSAVSASVPSNAFRFFHDADGRLKAAIDPEGETATYNWDAAGNLLSISRHASSQLSLVQLNPPRAQIGATVTIEGTGFSVTPTSDIVKFNGTTASVIAATANSLTVKVPNGATTGSVTVSTPGEGPVASAESFTVLESLAPNVSSISPSLAVSGEEVTVSGSHFGSNVAGNDLILNGVRPEITSASSSTLKFKVPTGTLGGYVSVSTAEGLSIGPDLFIPPNGLAASKVGWTGRFSLGESKTVGFEGSEKVALLLFDGSAGRRVLLSFSESSITSGTVSIWSPSGAQVASSSFSKSGGGFLEETSPLPMTGTYTVLLTPTGTSAGSVKVSSSDFPGFLGSITPAATAEGTTQKVATSFAGQVAHYAVTLSAGAKVALKTNNANFTSGYTVRWLKPNGEQLYSQGFGAKENWFWDTKTFATAGTYTLVVDPEGAATGSVNLQLWEAPDKTGQTITPSSEGGSVTSTISIPGQRELITFSGTKDQSFSWKPTQSTITANGAITLLRPNGSTLASSGFTSNLREPVVSLPESGTYTLVVDPSTTGTSPAANGTGSVKVTAYEVSGNPITPAATAEGTTQKVATSFAGQVAHYAVTLSAGAKVALKTNNANFTSGYTVRWLKPNGEQLYSQGFGAKENWFWDTKTFATAGTYTLVVDPEGAATGSVNLQLWEAPDKTGQTITPSSEGGSVTSTISIPGQRELITFSGTKDQSFSWKPTQSTITANGAITLLRPNGSTLASSGFTSNLREPVVSLPESGTYTLVVDPSTTGTSPAANGTGSVKVTAYEVSGNPITPAATAEGTTQKVATSFAGQVAHYAVTLSAGAKVALKTNNANFTSGYTVRWLKPNGEQLYSQGFGAKENWFWDTKTFATAGTYTLVVDPEGAATGSVDLQLWEAPDKTGQTITPSSEGGSVTSTISIPGQRELITFSGTKDQSFSWKPTQSTITANGAITLLRPNGSTLASSGFTSNLREPVVSLPESGTYTLVVDPSTTGTSPAANGTGSVKVTAYEVSGNPITPAATAEGTTQKVATSFAGQVAHYAVTLSAGAKVALKTNNANFTSGYTVRWLKPNGEQLYSQGFGAKENWFWDTKTFATAGTYTLVVDPEGAATGSVDLQLWEAPDKTGQTITPSSEGGSVTSTISIPGQRELITFSGTASQLVTVKGTESTITSGTMWVLKPDETKLSGSEASFSPSSAGRRELTLPSTGSYTIVVDPPATGTEAATNGTGSVKVTVYLGSHVAWFGPLQPRAELVSLVASNPSEPPEYSDISGQFPANSSYSEIADLFSTLVSSVQEGEEKDRRSPDAVRARSVRVKEIHRGVHPGNAGSSESQVNKYAGVSEPKQRVKHGNIAAEMAAFHPAAVRVWHPPRDIPGWEAAEPNSPWAEIRDLEAPNGTTALTGQALERNGLPLAGVRVSVEDTSIETTTDEAGRFLLSGLPAGRQTLVVDGESMPGDRRYGGYEVTVDLENHKTTVLDYTIWLSPLDPAGDRVIASPTERETSLTTPSIPGLEVRIPAGTVIRDVAGKVVKDLNITAIPVNQAPFPLPPFVPIPVYFTVQPGSAYLSKGAQIVYPNWGDLRPGQRAEFWNYDAEDRGWYVYGRGTVSADGKQVVPDPGVRVWQFTGAMLAASPLPPATQPTGTSGGDPVDLFSGLFIHSDRDLVLPDTIPIVLQRTYRQSDSNSYSFGIGTTNYYDMRLWSGTGADEANLILPNGERIHFARTSPGTGYSDGIYKSTSTPGTFYALTLTYNPSGGGAYWNLNLTNGMTFVFGVGRLLEIRDPHGNRLAITRSGENVTQITSPHGRWVKFVYDGANRITEATDNGGRHVKYTYTSGRLTKVTDAAGRTTEYTYNGSSQMTSLTNGRGQVFLENEYDAGGRVKKQTMGDGGSFEFNYELDGEGNIESTTLTDPRGSKREFTFDPRGLPTRETVGLETENEATTTYEWQPKTGLILSTTDPLSRQTDFEYDSNGNITEITRLAGTEDAQTDEFAYEPGTDRMTEMADSLGRAMKYEYGINGELLKETDPLGHATTYEYNGDGQLVSITNPENEETELTYSNGDLVAETDPLGRKLTQFIDSLGRARAITAPGGQRTLYGYNAVSELTSVTTPSGAETAIEYNADGKPISVTDPRGGETTAAYDVMGRLESVTDPLEHETEFSYDKAGLLEEVADRRGLITQFDYDALGRRTAATYGVSGESAESTVEYGYDGANRLTDVDDSASGEYALSYDDLDRLTAMNGPNGTVGYDYTAAGSREAMTATGLGTVGYEYDNADRLTEVAAGEQTISLAYDKADRLESLILPNGIEQEFSYNEAGEPTSIAYRKGEATLGEINYAFDLNGRTEAMWGSYARLALPEALGSAKYNAANELVEREGEKLEYDAEGQLTSDGANEYSWDARGQLSAISGADPGSFAYDPFGRRISKTLGGTTTDLLHDGPNVIQESVEGSVTANLLSGPSMDQLFSRTTAEGTDSYLTSLLGSVVALSNSSGEVETTYAYDPFGSASEAGEPSDNPFQYTGRENDGNGLQYNRARYYQSSSARFISQDPIGFDGGTANLYEYGANDPLDHSDPSGLCVLGLPCPSSQDVVNASAGIGDSLLSPPGSGLGPIPNIDPGPYLRDRFGIDNVEECSGTYQTASTGTEIAQTVRTLTNLPKTLRLGREAANQLSRRLDETMVHVPRDW